MRKIKISAAYAEHASIKRYKKYPDERMICVPITTGLGFSCVITESIGKSEHVALLGFHVSSDHPQMPKVQLSCNRKITQLELDTVIDALAKTDINYLKNALADMFWLPPELQKKPAKSIRSKSVRVKSKAKVYFNNQPDLFETA